jgi:hypothetical protein
MADLDGRDTCHPSSALVRVVHLTWRESAARDAPGEHIGFGIDAGITYRARGIVNQPDLSQPSRANNSRRLLSQRDQERRGKDRTVSRGIRASLAIGGMRSYAGI